MQNIPINRSRIAAALLGQCFILLFAALLFFDFPAFSKVFAVFENRIYDFQMRHIYKPPKENPIAIIDVDDASLRAIGTWPWSRDVLAQLTQKLSDQGVLAVAWDFVFTDPQKNIIEAIAPSLPETVRPELEQIKSQYDYDAMFAKNLGPSHSILGFILKLKSGESTGILPPPLLTLPAESAASSLIPDMKSFIGNTPVLQNAVKNGGFLNATPDADGVHRQAPLLLRMGEQVYPSLALESARVYLVAEASLITEKYGNRRLLEGIQLDQTIIPTNPYGQILIPFRGQSFSTPSFSAVDLLQDKIPKEQLQGKLVFIGTSATGMGDLIATSISPASAGVQIQAILCLGLIDGYLPYKPAWGQGAVLLLVLAVGSLASWVFPWIGPFKKTFVFLFIFGAIVLTHFAIWNWTKAIFPLLPLLAALTVVYLADILFGYVSETHQRKTLKSLFGQYLPKERIEELLEKKNLPLEGNSKELTVLFADIRGFTSISEKMSASQLKQFLNDYLTPMTEIIFKHQGTIDKYVGDMIVAFWGAPIPDERHASDAVISALEMQKKLEQIGKVTDPPFKVGIGINTGMMNVGDMGSQYRRAYTVLGDAVNLGSRLEDLTKYYKIYTLVGEETVKQTKDFCFRKVDRVRVKGKEKAIEIYEPVAAASECTTAALQLIKKNDEAFEAYVRKDWSRAETLFRQMLEEDSSRQAYYELFLERIAAFKKTPPAADWDGATTFLTK